MAGFDLLQPLQQQNAAAALMIFIAQLAHYFNFSMVSFVYLEFPILGT